MNDFPTRLAAQQRFLANVAERARNAQTPDGRWSAAETFAHLARYHAVMLARVDVMLTSDAPELPRYSAETDDAWPEWRGRTIDESLRAIDEQRAELMRRLGALTAGDWLRTGVHGLMGALTLSEWLEFFLVHEAHHLYTLLTRRR